MSTSSDREHLQHAPFLFVLAFFVVPVWSIFWAGAAVWLSLLPFALVGWLVRRVQRRAPPPPVSIALAVHEPEPRQRVRDTLLLVHGFPDSPALWQSTVTHLTAAGYRCLVAALPGAHGEPVPSAPSADAIVRALHEALMRQTTEAVTLVVHDWGSFYGFLLATAHPHWVRRIVSLDIGGHLSLPDAPLSATLGIVSYQSVLASAYLMGGLGGRLITGAMCALWRYPARPLAELTPDMCWPYWAVLCHLGAGLLRGRGLQLLDYTPQRPTLFAYAADKPFMFHSAEWLSRVRAAPSGEVVRFECGHWMMVDRPAELHALLAGWLERSAQRGK